MKHEKRRPQRRLSGTLLRFRDLRELGESVSQYLRSELWAKVGFLAIKKPTLGLRSCGNLSSTHVQQSSPETLAGFGIEG